MATRLTDEQTIALIQGDMDTAKKYQEQLSTERERLYRVYRAEKYGNESPKWSQTVHSTAMTAVEWLKPGLFEVFSGDFFQIKPVPKEERQPVVPDMATYAMQQQGAPGQIPGQSPGKKAKDPAVESAERIQKYIRKKLYGQLDGDQIVEDFIHNCLVNHYGIFKVCYRDDYDVETEKAPIMSYDDMAALQESDKSITEIKGGKEVVEYDPLTLAPVWSGIEGATIVRKKQIYNGFHVEVIPPWELYFLPGYDSLSKCPFVAHVVRRDLDYIKRQELAGVYRKGTYDKVKERIGERRRELPETAGEHQSLYSVDNMETPDAIGDTSSSEKQRLAANEVWLWECYCKLDMDGDGLLQPYIVTVCEDVVLREPVVNPYGGAPFELGYILKEPHKILGRPIPALLEDRQKVMSNLLRFIQDSAARSTYGGWMTSSHQSKLMLQRMGPGDVAWTPDVNQIKEIQPSAPSQFIFEAFNLTKQEISAECGVNENMQGLDDNSLNKTAAGMNMRMTAGMQRQKLYARRIARTFKRVLRRIIDIMRMWPPQDDVEMIGADVIVRPEDLQGHYDIDIEVGVGPQDRAEQAQALEQLVVFGSQVGIPEGMMTRAKLAAAQKAKFDRMGVDATPYFNTEEEIEANESQQVQMQQMQEQLMGMQQQMEQLMKDGQAAMQQAQTLEQENQTLKSQPPEDKSLEVAKLRLDAEQSAAELGLKAEVERAKLDLEQARLELERIKLGLEEEKIEMDAQNRAAEMQFRAMQPPKGQDSGEKKPETPPRPSKRKITVIRDGQGRITGAESIENAEEQEITA